MNATQRLGLIAIAMALTSCSLPPSQAWRIVKTQGLFPYVSMEIGKRPFPSGVTPLKRGIHLVPGKGTPRSASSESSTSLASLNRPTGLGNPYLQLNTRQVSPSSLAVAPRKEPVRVTTPKTAAVPAPAPVIRQRIPINVGSPPPAPTPKPVVTTAPPPAPMVKPTSKPAPAPAPKIVQTPAPKPVTPPLPKPAPPANKPVQPPAGSAATSIPVPSAALTAPGEVPTATAIPGRRGFVNSPFAAKHQIVDVTGLKPGQEVKCPFSGKLFRIPADALNPPPANP